MALYYECHVTIEPVYGEQLEHIKDLASAHGFKVASLLMKKRETDTAERSQYDTFMTSHSKGTEEGFADIRERQRKIVQNLQEHGFQVWRYKIEDVVIDSRHGDSEKLLSTDVGPDK